MPTRFFRWLRARLPARQRPAAAPPADDPGGIPSDNLSDIPSLVRSGRAAQAEQRLRLRLATAPDDVDALHFLGLLCQQSARMDEAVALVGKAAALAPKAGFIHANYAEVLRMQGDHERAERHAREAVRLSPDQADFQFNLAVVLFARRRHADADRVLDRVLAGQSDHVEALSLKADACFELNRMEEALRTAGQAHALAPENARSHLRLIRMRAWACDWRSRDSDTAALIGLLERRAANPGNPALRGFSPFIAYEYPVPQRLRTAVADLHAADIRESAGVPLDGFAPPIRAPHARLRIGYVSADFHNHPTMHLMNSLFGLHDRGRFEIFAYSIGPDDGSEYRRRAIASVDHFMDIRTEPARQSAERIRRDGIDILVDLKGHTHDARPEIFALRPAPIRVAWLGYPASTGAGLNDYAIVDRVTVPPENAGQFAEKLVWMPHSYQVNDHRQPIAANAPSRAGLGLPENGFVYACFNHVYKIEPPVFRSWMRILARVPGSVLWLYGSNTAARDNLRREAADQAIGPERILFGETMDKPAHLARLAKADLFLDTYSCNAHTSAADALWTGLPVLTLPGDAFPARVAASLVSAAGLAQLVCGSRQEYEDTAVRLAAERPRLDALRRTLASRERLPLFDTPRFTRDLETAFEMMWQRHAAGAPPESFAVE